MKRMKVTGKELALLCGMAALGTLTFPLGAAARTVDSVTATAGSTAEIVYSGETLTVTNGVESIGNNATGIRAVDDTEVAIGKDINVQLAHVGISAVEGREPRHTLFVIKELAIGLHGLPHLGGW